MQDSARSLARYGRHGDNNLVHVSDKELRGIETLTGKKFTRNPHTGLPEAFSFGKMLGAAAPVVAGIGGTILSGGNPMVGALAAGATSGAVAKMEGKSTEQALTQGLISGITSYAGGQVMQGIGDVGAAQAASQAVPYGPPVPDASSVAAAPMEAGSLQQVVPPPPGGSQPIPAAFTAGQPSAPSYESALESIKAGRAANVGGAPQFGNIDQGLARTPEISNITTALSERPGAVVGEVATPRGLIAGLGTAYQLSNAMYEPRTIPGETPYDPNKYPPKYPENPRTWNPPPSSYVPGTSPEWRYFAKGGIASLANEDRGMTSNIMNEAKAAVLGEHPRPSDALNRFRETFGDDALAVLRDRLTGGRVRGAGGGMDDLVPGTIEGRQKVRLADGEFVVPADVVSGLGDGSTDQGVRRLHEMMDKVRKTRTGKEAQPKAIGGRISV